MKYLYMDKNEITYNGLLLMTKIARTIKKLCKNERVDLLDISKNRKHLILHFDNGIIVAARTPSDCKWWLNLRAEIRRLHRLEKQI